VEITVYDPDYDLDGSYAEEITAALVSGLAPVRTAATRPDLIAARRDLATRADERHTPAATFAPAATFPRAAAAMSGGGSPSGTPEEAAGPAVTMPGVADGDEVEGREPAWTGESGDDTYDQAADDEVAVDDTVAGGVTGDEPVNHWPVADDDPQPLDGHPAESEPHGAVSEHDDAVSGHDDGVSEHDDRGFQHDDGFAHGGGGSVHDQQQVPGGPLVPRPLGSSPMLDSEPLPATRPGMLRPRPSEDNSFTLPVQRPAFDISGEKPADIS
jgi:arginase